MLTRGAAKSVFNGKKTSRDGLLAVVALEARLVVALTTDSHCLARGHTLTASGASIGHSRIRAAAVRRRGLVR